jgi:transcriptional regulator with XRE-family HTH domain
VTDRYRTTLGERVGDLRRERGLKQQALATVVGRSVSWVSQVERGEITVGDVGLLQRLAAALGAPSRELVELVLGEEAGEAEHQRPYVEVLRLALAGHPAPGAAMGVSARIRELQPDRWQAQVAEAWALVHASNFEALGPLLARLVPALEGASRRPGDAAAPTRALILLADAYQVAAAMLVKVGDVGAGWIAADRAIAAGERCGDRCLVMAGQLRMAHTFVDSAEEDLALHVLRQAVALAGGLAADTEAGLVSLTGACALLLAVLEARRGNATEARRHLKAAVRLARRLGEDRNDYGTEFGPTKVALHEVAVEVELGNASEALRLAAGVDTSALSAERRARFLVDMARAHVQRRALAPAVAALIEAETIAPGEVADSRRVRELLDDLDHLARGRPIPGLRALRRRITHN